MSTLKKLLGDTAVYGLSSILGRFLNYLLVPLHTSVFLPEQYGVITELYAEVAFLNIVYTFGLETTFFRFATKTPDKKRYFLNISQSIILTVALSLSLLIFLLAPQIAAALGYQDYIYIFRWLGLIMAIDAIVAIPFADLRLQGKSIKFASFKISNIVINLGLNLIFLWLMPKYGLRVSFLPALNEESKVGYVFLANLIANSFYLLFFAKSLLRIRITFDFQKWRPMLIYAWPLVFMGFAGVTNEMFSRVMLKYLLPEGFYPGISNQAALGIFGACYKLSIFMALSIQAFKYAAEPLFFKESTKSDAKNTYKSIMSAFVFFGASAWIAIVTVLPELAPIFILDPSYLEGLGVVPVLLGANLLLGIYYNLSVWYKVTDKTQAGAAISIIGMVLTVILNMALIPLFGYMGSAWVTFIVYFLMVSISYFWGQRAYPVSYNWPEFLIVFLVALSVALNLLNPEIHIALRYIVGFTTSLILLVLYFWRLKNSSSY